MNFNLSNRERIDLMEFKRNCFVDLTCVFFVFVGIERQFKSRKCECSSGAQFVLWTADEQNVEKIAFGRTTSSRPSKNSRSAK